MAAKKPTHVINHDNLYLMVDGKLTKMKRGEEIALKSKDAKVSGGKILKIGQSTAKEVGDSAKADKPAKDEPAKADDSEKVKTEASEINEGEATETPAEKKARELKEAKEAQG